MVETGNVKLFGLEIFKSSEMKSLREAMTTQRRALEDIGWTKVNHPDQPFNSLVSESYLEMVRRSRLAYIKNPIVSHAVHLTTWYTFGQGISLPKSQDKEVQDIISEFWNDKDNRSALTSEWTQMLVSNKLQYDGELALLLTLDRDGTIYLRTVDPLTIVEIIRDPTDTSRPLFYRRSIRGKNQYVADWQNGIAVMEGDNRYSGLYEKMLKDLRIRKDEVVENALLFHVKNNCDLLDVRGIPEVFRALDWINANNKINSDTASFINAQAQFAWKMKIAGTKNSIQRMKAQIGQSNTLNNPAYQSGSMATMNDKVSFDPVGLPSSTGALFEVGIRRTLLMCCAAFGLMEHYFGDAGNANLATATAMELPMLKKFQARQKMFESIYHDLLNFQLDMKLLALNTKAFELNQANNRIVVNKAKDYGSRVIDIDFPPILEKDIKNLADAMSSAKSGQLIPKDTAQRIFMQGAGVNNIDDELKKEFSEPPAPAPNPFQQQPPQPQPPPSEPKKPVSESVTGKSSSVNISRVRVADMNKDMLRKVNSYIREIAGEYNQFVKGVAVAVEVFRKPDEQYASRLDKNAFKKTLESFIVNMHKLAVKYYPKAIDLGESYVRSQIGIKESATSRILESKADALLEDLVDRNEKFLRTSLKPALAKGVEDALFGSFETEEGAVASVAAKMAATERRVGMYGSELWTVAQRAVKEVGKSQGDQKANFIGVEDSSNCDGCAEAIGGNPWNLDAIPVPGDQPCMSNCRHAIQIVGDENLTESDIQLLSDAESESKKGYKLLSEGIFEATFRDKGTKVK